MKRTRDDIAGTWLGIALAGSLCGSVAAAQEPAADTVDALELTMTLLPEDATTPDAVTRTIQLPDAAALRAAPPGLEQANDARERRAGGRETAAEARERGREFGRQVAEQAQEGRENAGRGPGGQRPDRPEPNVPGPPEDRGPPPN